MNLIVLALLILILVNLHVIYRELRRMRKQTDLRVQGLHARLDGISDLEENKKSNLVLTPDLSARVEMLVAGGNEANAISEICDALCVGHEAAARIVENSGNQ